MFDARLHFTRIFGTQQILPKLRNVCGLIIAALITQAGGSSGAILELPPRSTNAPDGDMFVHRIAGMDLAQRDAAVAKAFLAGDAPDFLRRFCPVTVTNVAAGTTNIGTFFVAPDYLAIGSDENYFFAPVSPGTAQRIAGQLHCTLPTRRMVDAIYAAAIVKLAPTPIPPSPAMTTVPIFARHNEMVRAQRLALTNVYPLGALVAGDKKDVVVSARLAGAPGRVAIYGWHQTNGVPIQPLFLGHVWWWVDYSQCVRLVSQFMLVNGQSRTVPDVLADPKLCGLLSDEGVITNARYSTNDTMLIVDDKIDLPWPKEFSVTSHPGEWAREVRWHDGARILVNSPSPENHESDQPVLLIFYALPNGGTIEQAIGKRINAGGDWHFGAQNIGAQTRWLRQAISNKMVVVAYLEADTKSWPAWRRQHGDQRIADIINGVCGIFSSHQVECVLASHSGGGSLVFGYLNTVDKIPARIKRIAFLDSDYAYDSARDAGKLENWLAASSENHLCVLAYQDYLGRLNGKPFVSENGGTWGRSHALLNDLSSQFQFTSHTNDGLEEFSAKDGQIEFWLKENPGRKIFHTMQVERNGFIQAILSGTSAESQGYEYFGEPVYTNDIE